jgi:DNA adenine methylase
MKYMGSKNRYAKDILSIILQQRKEQQFYVEPFCGGCNVIDKVKGNRIANDSNYYLMQMWSALVNDGWIPPSSVSEDLYNRIKVYKKEEYDPCLVGFVGIGCSYGGKWFGGYARGSDNKGVSRNYCMESKRNVLKQINGLRGCVFLNKNYLDLTIPANSIVYCDPPYANVTKYTTYFNHSVFWQWVRNLVDNKHIVFVSEYNAPNDFKCVWQREVNNTLIKDTGAKKGMEKLFVHESFFGYIKLL